MAENPAKTQRRHTDDAIIEAWLNAIAGAQLRKRAAKLARALLDLATDKGRVLVSMSTREAATACTVGLATIQSAFGDLRAAGMIEVAGTARGHEGTRYRLLHPTAWTCGSSRTVSPLPLSGGVGELTVRELPESLQLAQDINSPVWSHAGLGPRARLVYLELITQTRLEASTTVAAVADAIGRNTSVVSKILKRLAEAGLARRVDRTRWAPEYVDPASLIEDLGVDSWIDEVAERYETDQRAHRMRLTTKRLQQVREDLP